MATQQKIFKKMVLSLFVFLLLGMSLISAQYNTVNFKSDEPNKIEMLHQQRNMFQERYNFSFNGECNYAENENGKVTLQVMQQKRFLFWDVNAEENYVLSEDGEVVQARYNIWSRLLNRERIKV